MSLPRKLLVVALASVMPMASVYAQSAADLQKDIAILKAQLQALQQKVDALTAQPAGPSVAQQITRVEQKQELADDAIEKAGLKGLKFKGVAEAAYAYDTSSGAHTFASRDGTGAGGSAMLELTKETEEGEGVNWTLRLTPGASNLVQEATVSVGVAPGTRLYGGFIPDFQGYEALFAHQNLLVSHNALYDLAGPTAYTGLGLTHQLDKNLALKWMVGNIDSGNDVDASTGLALKPSVGLAYRFDWTLSEYAYLGLSGAHASSSRSFDVVAADGGYTRGDWQLNGQLTLGQLKNGAYAGGDVSWTGVSGLVGYKLNPRLQLLARADFFENRKNGGGTYVSNYLNNPLDVLGTGATAGSGLGPEMDSSGVITDPSVGANLTRLSLGANYLLNATTLWKSEIRFDQSTGYNFTSENGAPKRDKTTLGTSLVVSF
ncbi:MAG: hypothetical protein CFE44_17010 [Burkholderiales bacterium PBB4]|nr:MAG: hypothetical protein CFE44_17010 [Burkholderiales bacterium PBB4]